MRPGSLGSSPRTYSFANAAALADPDGVKTAVATKLTADSYDGADFNGALGAGPISLEPPRYPSVTTTVDAATYNVTDPIVFNGTRGGLPATAEVLLTQAGGGETVVADEPLDTLDSIDVPAQSTINGEFTFGWSGVACRKHGDIEHPFRRVRAVGAGNLKLGFTGGKSDTLVMADTEKDDIEFTRVYPGGDTTVGVRIYE